MSRAKRATANRQLVSRCFTLERHGLVVADLHQVANGFIKIGFRRFRARLKKFWIIFSELLFVARCDVVNPQGLDDREALDEDIPRQAPRESVDPTAVGREDRRGRGVIWL